MIALEQRRNEDDRTLGELFFLFTDELSDITFVKAFQIILDALIESICMIFQLTEEQMNQLMKEFFARIPAYMQRSLQRCAA